LPLSVSTDNASRSHDNFATHLATAVTSASVCAVRCSYLIAAALSLLIP
jgi:hypothetical protein